MDQKVLGSVLAPLAVFSLAFIACAADTVMAEENDGDDPGSPIDYLRGYVFEIPPQQDRVPIQGLALTTWLAVGEVYEK